MAKSSVPICGMDGLGVEIAKNVILTGLKRVTIQDTKATTIIDLSSQYYLRESDLGRNRAVSCLPKLQELNRSIEVSTFPKPLTTASFSGYNTVVFTEALPESKLVEFDEF
jgi:ubiquitin-activating enzyme E1